MGLLDSLSSPDAVFALGLLQAASPQPRRVGLGEGLLSALGQAQASQFAAEDRAMKKQMQDAQLGLLGAQLGDVKAQAILREQQARKLNEGIDLARGLLSRQGGPSQYGLAGGGLSLGGVSEPMQPQAGGIEGMTPTEIAAVKLAADKDLLNIWQAAQSGTEVKPGSFYMKGGRLTYQADPTKGVTQDSAGNVGLMPGSIDAQAALAGATKGAEAKATASWAPFTSLDSSGAQVVNGSVADAIMRSQQTPNATDRQARIRAGLTPDATFSSPAVREYVMREAGMQGQPDAAASGGGIKVGQSPREKVAIESLALGNQAFMKDRYTPALEASDTADKTLASIQTARAGLQKFGGTGWGAEAKAWAASILGALGVPQAEQVASGSQMFQSAAMDRLWTTLNAAKGMQTEGDADRASKTWARLKNTPEANAFILDMAQAVAERDKMKADYYKNALPFAQQNGDLQEIDRRWSSKGPSIWSMPSLRRWTQ